MLIKIKRACVGINFSYSKGSEVNANDAVAKDLIKAGFAEEIKKDSLKSKAGDKSDVNS